jgi:hypothetical protein
VGISGAGFFHIKKKKENCKVLHIFAIQALRKVELAIKGRKDCRIKDLSMMGVFSHTGCNEALNNLHNKVGS